MQRGLNSKYASCQKTWSISSEHPVALFLVNLLNLFCSLSSSQLQSPILKFNHSFQCLKKWLFSLTAPVQSHLSSRLAGSPYLSFQFPSAYRNRPVQRPCSAAGPMWSRTMLVGCAIPCWMALGSYGWVDTESKASAATLGAEPPAVLQQPTELSSPALHAASYPRTKLLTQGKGTLTIQTFLFLDWLKQKWSRNLTWETYNVLKGAYYIYF